MGIPWGLVLAFGALVALEKIEQGREERNPEFFTANGVVHPIRNGKGIHDDWGGAYNSAIGDRLAHSSGKAEPSKAAEKREANEEAKRQEVAADVGLMIKSDTMGYRILDDLEKRLEVTKRSLAAGRHRPVAGNLRGGDRPASTEAMRAYIQRVEPLVARRKRLLEERRQVKDQQQALYAKPLNEAERRAAGQQYKLLKRRQEEIEKGLQVLE